MTTRSDRDWLPTWRSYAAIGPAVMRVKAAAIVAEIEARLTDSALVVMEGVAGKCEGAVVTTRAYGGAGEGLHRRNARAHCERSKPELTVGLRSSAEGRSRLPPPPSNPVELDLFG